MAKNKKTKKLRFGTLALSGLMLVAASSFVLAACAKDPTDEEESTVTRTDTQTFANANFEYFDDNDGSYLIGTAESWTSGTVSNSNGVSASSSVSKSGIVDTSLTWGTDFLKAYSDFQYYDNLDEDDPELEDAEYYTDIDNLYDIPGWDIAKAAMDEDSDEDPSDEAITSAATALNPGTHWAEAGTEDEENGTHVLMLHNYRSNNMGTAAKYTSSSVTLSAGTAAKFSVWVKTSNLTYNEGIPVDGNRGAFIQITNTVGGVSQDPLIVRNIDTSGITANNGWEQYTFYVQASSYATTTFSVVLGLGMQTEGTESNYYEYVQGYAFFDDLSYELLTQAECADQVADEVPATQQLTLSLAYGSDLQKIDAAGVSENFFSLNLDDLCVAESDTLPLDDTTIDSTKDERGNTYSSYFRGQAGAISDSAIAADLNRSGVVSLTQIRNDYSALSKDFEKFDSLPFARTDEEILLLYSASGAPYTATLRFDSASATENTVSSFSLAKDQSMFISFWVKTSDLEGSTGATITLVDADTKTSIGAVDTTTLTATDLKDDQRELKDIFDGWQQCFLFVTNTTENEEPIDFYLQLSYGIKEISGSALSDYIPGYAAFSGFRYGSMTEEQFSLKTTGTYAVEVSLTGGVQKAENVFDDTAYTNPDQIKTDIADLRNYQGVFGGSTYVGGETLTNGTDGIDRNSINALNTAGLINRDYANSYQDKAWLDCVLSYAGALEMTQEVWDKVFGSDCLQPLLIANTAAQAYGFLANSASSVSSSSYTAVTVRVKLSPNATASVYLIDTTDADFGEQKYTDSIYYRSGVSYRYDNNGNVVNMDPTDKGFSSKTNTVLWMQDNGLWATEQNYTGDTFYANLANYERDEETGNLLSNSGSVVYYASDEDGVYYRYYDKDKDRYSVRVQDFADADVDLTGALLQTNTEKALSRSVTNTSSTISDWMYVRFFIATGDESKNYRLEVWSGTRDGKTTNPADSFVAFDVVSYGTIDADTFNNLVSARLDDYADDLDLDGADALQEAYEKDPASFIDENDGKSLIYYTFSLYDDDSYTSYDADYSDATSDPYADYDGSSYSATVAYLNYRFTSANRLYYDTYVNYGANEVTVSTSTTDDDTTEEEDTTSTSTQNVWLLASSIVLAAILILTLLLLLLKNLLSNLKKKNSSRATPMYDNKRKRYIRKLRLEESESDELADDEQDVLPDEDEISEEDIYRIDSDNPDDSDPNNR